MYTWLVLIHVLSVFVFLLAHGTSVSVAFRLRNERELERIRALLMLSGETYRFMYPSLLVIVLTGVAAGFQAHWWLFGWIWLSLALVIVLVAAMSFMGGNIYSEARRAAGLPYFQKGKLRPAEPAAGMDEVLQQVQRVKPLLLTWIGLGGLAVITWLMMAKPF